MNKRGIEGAITELAKEFRCNSLNFIKEEDLRSKLYSIFDSRAHRKKYVDNNKCKAKLYPVHANWFGLKSRKKGEPKGYCDLVILSAYSMRKLQSKVGEPTRDFASLPCYAGIEIKRWPGQLHSLPNNSDSADIRDLRSMIQNGKVKYGYALVFIDHDISEKNNDKFNKIIEWYQQQTEKTEDLYVWLIPREGEVEILSGKIRRKSRDI